MSFAEVATGVIGIILIPGLFVWMAIVIWFVHRRLDELLGYLTNSRGLDARGGPCKGGPRTMLISFVNVGMLVTFSRYFISKGQLSDVDMRSLPESLRRQLVTLHVAGLTLVGGGLIFGAILKLADFISQ